MTARYYVDPSESGLPDTSPRAIYDNADGMPAVIVETQNGHWTAERQALLEAVLRAVNTP
jgi:hypothetical protein